MTEPTDPNESGFESRLRRDLDAIASAVPAGAATATASVARPARTRRWVAVAAALVLIGAGVIWTVGRGDDGSSLRVADTTTSAESSPTAPSTSTSPETTTSLPPDEVAPPSETGTHRIWIANPVVPESGGVVVFAMVGPPSQAVYGTVFGVDRWDGEEWREVGGATSCAFPRCAAELIEGDGPIIAPSLGMNVPASGVAFAEALDTTGLAPGWYRIGRNVAEDDAARGVFRVVPDADLPAGPPSPTIAPEGEYRWRIDPIVSPTTGGRLTATISGPPPEPNALAVDQIIERWDGAEWVAVFAMDTAANDLGFMLPSLPAGDYRMVSRDDRTVESRFWVSDDIGGGPVCPPIPELDDLLGVDAAAFGPRGVPTAPARPAWRGGYHVQWESPDRTIRYSYPMGSVIDLVGERYFQDGPLLLRPLGDAVEVWVELPGCGDTDTTTAGFLVSGGSEQQDVSLAARLGRSLAERGNADGGTRVWEQCPDGESVISTPRNGVILDVWMYCREVGDTDSRLVPVATNIISESPIESVIRRGLGGGWNGLESAIPLELQWSLSEITIADGLLTIDWGWDFSVEPIDNISTSYWSARIIAQIAANAFQFDEIDAVDLSPLPFETDDPHIYTREQWESSQDQ